MSKKRPGIDAPINLPGGRRWRMVDPRVLTPDPRNPRRNEEAVAAVVASIKKFGFRDPIELDGEGKIVAGHTRLKAALDLGLDLVPILEYTDMKGSDSTAYLIANNRTHEVAGWDDVRLHELMAELNEAGFEMPVLGFDDSEVDAILAMEPDVPPPTEFPIVDSDLQTAYRCPNCGHEWSGSAKP